MEKDTFKRVLDENSAVITQIKETAHALHASVNQHYDKTKPYSVHLDSVAYYVTQYAAEVCQDSRDVVPIIFGAYYHDSMEDARLTYNNVMRTARALMDEQQALMATEIVYALTNEKGRTRAERANDRYYQGIRTTPYAPLCKFADRLANATYSVKHNSDHIPPMREVYAKENPHFIAALTADNSSPDPRLTVPKSMIDALKHTLEG